MYPKRHALNPMFLQICIRFWVFFRRQAVLFRRRDAEKKTKMSMFRYFFGVALDAEKIPPDAEKIPSPG